MDEAELDYWCTWIKNLTQLECARFWRHAPIDHDVFTDDDLYKMFVDHFKSVGGMTRVISRQAGWADHDFAKMFHEEAVKP